MSGAVEVEAGAGPGQQVDLVGRGDPEVAHLGQDPLAGRRLEASEVVECPVAQPGPERVGVDHTRDAGVVVVAGEDPVVGTAVGGLTLSDQEDGAAGLCQESGTGAPEHPPSDDRDIDVPGVHRLTGVVAAFSRRVPRHGPRRTCSRRGTQRLSSPLVLRRGDPCFSGSRRFPATGARERRQKTPR